MSQSKKTAKTRKKPITDVDKPGDSKPTTTSKPVIVTNRPILKDPMVVDEDAKAADNKTDEEKKELAHSTAPIIKPLDKPASESGEADKPDKPDKPETPAAESAPEESETPSERAPKTDDKPAAAKHANSAKQKSDVEPEPAEQSKHEAAIQHLIDSKKYELPINAVEKRKSKRFVALGIVLAIFLVLAWGDIAADAGIIHISGVKSVTHFFSN